MPADFEHLPITPYLDDLAAILEKHGLLLLSAETGAGKTTLFPFRLLSHPGFAGGKILLLEPRRLAARAAADRIASLLNEKTGQTVGLRTRLETLAGPATRLEVVTEGVLTRMLQADPSLAGVGTILFDEFHTRSLQGDLGLALAWDARKIFRPDLKIAILSATLPAAEIQKTFGPWPHVEVPGRSYPVEVIYLPPSPGRERPWEGAARLCREALVRLGARPGTVLCFLPGYFEMRRARDLLAQARPDLKEKIFLLHGRMPPAQQREVMDPARALGTRVIFSTNVAETSLTIPGVAAVVDLGLERRVRFSPRSGLDHWETLPVSRASAEQRRGRAGRLAAGVCFRWWDAADIRAEYAPPEIAEADMAPLVLETALWGADSPYSLVWLTPPPEAATRRALSLLSELGLLDAHGRITPAGREAAGLGVHPRLSKMILAARAGRTFETAAVVAALLENDDLLSGPDPDLRARVAAFRDWAAGHRSADLAAGTADRVWEDARRILHAFGRHEPAPAGLHLAPDAAGGLLLAAYPDRAAKQTRQENIHEARFVLASGRGALVKGALAREEFLAVADLDGGDLDARVFLAAPITHQDLEDGKAGPPAESWTLTWHGWKPKAALELKIGAILLKEKSGRLPPAEMLQQAALERLKEKDLGELPWTEKSRRFLARCRFIAQWGQRPDWPDFRDEVLLGQVAAWLVPFGHWQGGGAVWDESILFSALENYLGWNRRKLLDELAPESLTLPSGSMKTLDYESGEVPVLSGRVQEFFGSQTTPLLCGQPLLINLLSPAGRTVQLTRDLDGFWDRSYPAVKKELMGRYPRHPWPDNPRAAQPTRRAKPRRPSK